MPYMFNGKELDTETGLYYYGARYYDPRVSLWLNVDPMMLRDEAMDDEDSSNGGVFNPMNNAVYTFSYQNPLKYVDPDGECPNCITAAGGALVGAIIGGGIEAGMQLYKDGKITSWKAIGGSAAQGAITGAAAGFTGGASLAVTVGVAGGANVVGGVVNRAIQGKKTTATDVVIDATVGAAFGAAGKAISKLATPIANKATNKLTNIASSVLKELGKGKGPVYGIKAHAAFAKAAQGLKVGKYTIKTEVSYLEGIIVKHGTKGSARIDAGLYDSKDNLIQVFDLKTGGAKLTEKQIQHIQNHTTSKVPVTEIRGK